MVMDRWKRSASFLLATALALGSVGVMLAEDEPAEATTAPTAPALPDGLPRRDTPDVPLFAGPATLKVSGRTGSYTWHEVSFGAELVRTRVALVPDEVSCTVRLRLKGGEELLIEEWSSSASGERETHDALIDVDYLAGRLKVESDCRAWSVRFEPLADPGIAISIEETYYPVRGKSLRVLAAQTDDVKGRWAAYTEWYTSWVYWTREAEDGASCEVTHGETELEVTMTLPDWQRPADADPDLALAWNAFMENLRVHEQGHVTIALQGAAAIDDRLDAGFTASTCTEAGTMAEDAASRIFERYARASKRYDRKTSHGLTQGTALIR